jgi:predicted ribosomally synthesized peptide with SipW-like signal peptide
VERRKFVMKLTKKKVLVIALALSLIAILSMGTLAWFNAADEVVNDFNIAASDDVNPDDIFSINVWENTPDGDGDTDGFVYDDILPGDVLKKEVKVENTGYYDQYVRVTVTVSDAQAWMAALNTNGAAPALDRIVEGYDVNSNLWTDTSVAIDNDTLVYTLYYNGILLGDQDSIYDNAGVHSDVITVFTAVKIPTSLTVDQAAAFKNNFQVKVKAEAVQTENLDIDRTIGEGAKEAFEYVQSH